MRLQIRSKVSGVINQEIDNPGDVYDLLTDPNTEKISFDFVGGARLALYPDGTFQMFAGVVNYPSI